MSIEVSAGVSPRASGFTMPLLMARRSFWFDAFGILAFGVIYGLTAKLGLNQSTIASNVTLIWPPSGISLFVALRFGYRWWPGIVLGDLIGNFGTGAPIASVMGIAAGNILETLVCAWLLRRYVDMRNDLQRVRDVIALLTLGSACAALSAFVGPASLALGGTIAWSMYWKVWLQWLMGDATGVVVFTPLLLAWWRTRGNAYPPVRRVIEAAALACVALAISEAVFGGFGMIREGYYPAALAIFPLAVWAALRFGLRGATMLTLIVSTFAVWGTVHGRGPFVVDAGVDSLVRWWVFVNIITITSLVLAASRSERQSAQRALERERDFVTTIIDAAGAIVLVLDHAGRITRVNRAFEVLTGYRFAEVQGQRFVEALVSPDQRPKVEAHDEILRLKLSSNVHYESELVRGNGERLQVSWSNAVLRDSVGRISYRIVTGIDITERAEATQALRKARRELEVRVRERTAQLAATNTELQNEIAERQRLEREIIDTSEHVQIRIGQELHDDLGQQLTAIAFLTEVLAGRLAERGLPEAADATRIESLVSETVSQVRVLARGLWPVELETAGLMTALSQLATNVEGLFGLRCEFQCDAEVLIYDNTIAVNVYRIAQEALTNAVKHSGAKRVVIRLRREAEHVMLSIVDDGKGIVREYKGVDGMGLKTMQYRAKLIGADLRFEQADSGGLAVYLSMKNAPKAEAPAREVSYG